MQTRKIQLIAGSSYTVSLPKKWVQKNNLKEQREVSIGENTDGSLTVYPARQESDIEKTKFRINADEFKEDILQVLFAVYYLGFEHIEVYSKKDFSPDISSSIRGALRYMSGTEIVFESPNQITFRVLLDKSKVDIHQLYYRMGLLIGSSLDLIISSRTDNEEILRNEDEVDRLYQLIAKIIFLAQADTTMLISSNIGNVHYLISYLLIGKRLEHISDMIQFAVEKDLLNKKDLGVAKDILLFVKKTVNDDVMYLMNRDKRSYKRLGQEITEGVKKKNDLIKDVRLHETLDRIIRFVVDIQEELTSISFYNHLKREQAL